MIATGIDDPRCAALLLAYGASLKGRNDLRETVAAMAKRLKRIEILELMASHEK